MADARPRLYHLRTEQGRHEIDLLAEVGTGRVVGLEVKATSAPSLPVDHSPELPVEQ